MGIPAENDEDTSNLVENEDFHSLPIIQEFTEEKVINQNIPDCLKNDP